MMFKRKNKLTCPFCFKIFNLKNVKYRCINPKCSGRSPDSVFAAARDMPVSPQMGNAFHLASKGGFLGRKNRYVECNECSKVTSKRLCPECHYELSHDAGFVDDYTIAIVGGPDTGKGHYIATLIHRLQNDVGTNFGFGLIMLGDETRERYRTLYFEPLFYRRELLAATRSASVDITIKHPMIFRLTYRLGRRMIAVNMSFFDTAGEDMINKDAMASDARYISSADGIIFLLDPLQIDAVRQTLPEDILPRRDPRADPAYIVDRLREVFEEQRKLSPTQKVKTPIAFTLSKMDALLPIIDSSTLLKQTGPHFGYLDKGDSDSVGTEIWNYIQTWMGPMFNNKLGTAFQEFHYFGVSSLGHTPDSKGKLASISPVRVEDPFLWILYKLKLIKAK